MVKLNKIYTKTGDDGTTGLVDGSRVAKTDPRMAAIGDVDEANSLIGVAAFHAADEPLARLRMIQNDLFDLGADIATPGDDFEPGEMTLRVVPKQVERLEHEIDAMNTSLQPLRSFVLPGGSALAAHLHVARAAVRRAERSAVATPGLNPQALRYLNRLSDHLFTMARLANDGGVADVLWVPGASR